MNSKPKEPPTQSSVPPSGPITSAPVSATPATPDQQNAGTSARAANAGHATRNRCSGASAGAGGCQRCAAVI